MGLVQLTGGLATHPIRTIKQTGVTTGQELWHTWSPLLEGHVGEFGHRFVEHPLAPILDVATVATAGAGAVARVGKLAEAAGAVGAESRLARLGRSAQIEVRSEKYAGLGPLSKGTHGYTNPLIRGRKEFIDRQLKKLPSTFPGLGEEARFARTMRRQIARGRDAAVFPIFAMQKIAKDVSEGGDRGKLQTLVHQNIHATLRRAGFRWNATVPLHQHWVYLRHEDGPQLAVAADGKYFHQVKDGVWEERKSLSSKAGDKSIRVARGGAWEMSANGETAKAVALGKVSKRKGIPGSKSPQRFIEEESGDISQIGGYKKTLKPGVIHAPDGKKWVQVETAKYKLVDENPPGPTELRVAENQMLHNKGKRWYRKEGVNVSPGSEHWSAEKWAHELEYGSLKKRMYTRDASEAARNGDGTLVAMPKKWIDAYMGEGARSVSFLGRLHDKTTNVWRSLILGVPRFATNNVVGNTAMVTVGDPGALRYLPDVIRHVKGEKAAREMLQVRPNDLPYLAPGGLFGNVSRSTFGSTQIPDVPLIGTFEKKWYGLVGRWSEELYRGAMITKAVRNDPEITNMMRDIMEADPSVKRSAAENLAVEMKAVHDPQWHHQVQEHVEDILGNYEDLNRLERNIRHYVPFYTWNRAITRHVVSTFKDRPGRALALYLTGQQGVAETQKRLGDVPHFLTGAIPIGGSSGGRRNILTTQGLNPYQSFVDLAAGGLAALPGSGAGAGQQEALAQTLGPIAQTGVEFFSGTDLLTGQPTHKSLPGLLWANLGLDPNKPGLPQLRIIKEALSPSPSYTVSKRGTRYEKLYDNSVAREWAAAFGVPLKSLSSKAAKQRKKTEETGGR
jgi:hypothetical protein